MDYLAAGWPKGWSKGAWGMKMATCTRLLVTRAIRHFPCDADRTDEADDVFIASEERAQEVPLLPRSRLAIITSPKPHMLEKSRHLWLGRSRTSEVTLDPGAQPWMSNT